MDAKKVLHSAPADASIKMQGHTKHNKGFFGTDPDMQGMGSAKEHSTDLTI